MSLYKITESPSELSIFKLEPGPNSSVCETEALTIFPCDVLMIELLMVDTCNVERFSGSAVPPVKLIVVTPATVLSAMSVPPTRLGLMSAVSVVAVMSPLADIFEKEELPAVS